MLWWFAETTLVAGVLAIAAASWGRCRSLSASARHLLWLIVLIKLVTPPLVSAPWTLSFPGGLRLGTKSGHGERSVPQRELLSSFPETSSQKAATVSFKDVAVERRRRETITPTTVMTPHLSQPAWTVTRLLRGLGQDQWILLGWGLGTTVLALVQALRILSFQRRLREAVPAPDWLVDEATLLGERLRVRVPEALVVAGLVSPMLWCLGRPRLLLPGHLVKSVDVSRWRGILAHELAHLRRGDHWVSRLELVAGLFWWWSPLYWVTRRRLDAEAELACDAWVVRTLPHDRHAYAEMLLQICSEFSLVRAPISALGVAGSGRFFERRLSMVLHDNDSCRISPTVLAAACLLALLAVPSWSRATAANPIMAGADAPDLRTSAVEGLADGPAARDDDKDDDHTDADDDDDNDDDDADDDCDDDRGQQAEKSHADADHVKGKAGKSKGKAGKGDTDGSSVEKQIEAWAEKFAAEMEAKFGEGSEFARKMEAFGEEMEKKFGDDSEFARKMEGLGKEMEQKFGPGSDFEKKMTEKFGPGSDFEKKMKALGDDLEKRAARKRGAEEAAKTAEAMSKPDTADSPEAPTHDTPRRSADLKPRFKDRTERDRRIKVLESKIESLIDELNALKAADGQEEHKE